MACEDDVKDIFQSADCVCFDVDCTVCTDETIDELAKTLGMGDEVSKITCSAMRGTMSYKESMIESFNLIKPSQSDIRKFVAAHPVQLTPNIRELVTTLQERRIPVYLISGSFVCLIENVAEVLNIPKENIFANRLLFYYHGEFAEFDETQPTINTDGKAKVIQQLKDKHGYQRVVHIGDGVTDLKACPPADAFIGFGGNQIREKVKNGCHWFVEDIKELLSVLQHKDN
ncbi:hypothetical protein LSH36_295g03099 [Paralvinella palmiformis]|uniref:Phosphoserine phosphatase n=1 Tax=Paralvinella palmiformis TaxID=53620 RepID=A0AAD9JIA4_9ANNE|nr:hypothetical protein LSH36_295g03099 [Paralvinella palmiformis]